MTTENTAAAPALAPEAYLLQLGFGPLIAQALFVAARLGVADQLAGGPLPVGELAARTETHERSLYRILRSLAGVGVFAETEAGVFTLNPVAEMLRSDVPGSMRNGIIFMGETWHWQAWADTEYSVKTGKPCWDHVHGAAVFDYFGAHPDAAEIFNLAMTDMSMAQAPAVVQSYDFSGFKTLADIAGGHGYLLAQILKANPNLKGILFDMPSVIEGAGALFEQAGVAARVEKATGNFFEAVPAGADAYIMKHIIHDWDDERAIQILRSIQTAMPDEGKVLIVEAVVPQGNEPHYSKMLDLEMLTLPGGVERTADEFRDLLEAAGLRLSRIIPTPSPMSIVEAVKAK